MLGTIGLSIAYALIGLLALPAAALLALLLAPVRVRASGVLRDLRPEEGAIQLDALWRVAVLRGVLGEDPAWQFRVFACRVGRFGPRERRKPEDERLEERKRRVKPPEKRDGAFAMELWRQGLVREWMGPLLRALGDILRRPRCERLRGSVRFGTDDPAETGMLCGMAWALLGPMTGRPGMALDVQPDFLEPCAQAEGEVLISLRPATAMAAVVRLLWRGPTWRTIKARRAVTRKRRTAAAGAAADTARQRRVTGSGREFQRSPQHHR
jgi:hypothetical protein